MNKPTLLKTPQAAEYLSVSKQWLEKLRCLGEGPVFLKLGGSVVYDVRDLNEYINNSRRTRTFVKGESRERSAGAQQPR